MPRRRTPNAEIKLDAARHFLGRLQGVGTDLRAFFHNASAVLFSARSVDYALVHEAGEKYKNWRDSWLKQLTKEERTFATELISFRDTDVHTSGIPLSVLINVSTISADSVIAGLFVGTGLKRADAGEIWESFHETQLPRDAVLEISYEFSGSGGRVDALEACTWFVQLAERLLRDFRSTTP